MISNWKSNKSKLENRRRIFEQSNLLLFLGGKKRRKAKKSQLCKLRKRLAVNKSYCKFSIWFHKIFMSYWGVRVERERERERESLSTLMHKWGKIKIEFVIYCFYGNNMESTFFDQQILFHYLKSYRVSIKRDNSYFEYHNIEK